MPRFVILAHDHPNLHWDLMLETNNVLATWRLAQPPHAGDIDAIGLPDHRLMYLDYEGPVSGNRGNVQRWDVGTYIDEADSRPDLRSYFVEGARIRGHVKLERLSDDEWRFRYTAHV